MSDSVDHASGDYTSSHDAIATMRQTAIPLLAALAILAAGCAAPDAPTPASPQSCQADCAPASAAPPPPGARPTLAAGTKWTYADASVFDTESEISIVVAQADESGYLLAGATEADVVSGAVWGRLWFGRVSRDLAGETHQLFAFPLEDGKTWEARPGLQVTARAADVGGEPGFAVSGQSGTHAMSYDYSPSVGYFTTFHEEIEGIVLHHLELKSVGRSASWVHWERGEDARVVARFPPGGAPAATLQIAPGYDAVLASAGGARGGRVVVAPPDGGAWIEEFPQEEAWRTRVFPPREGAWTLAAAASQPDGLAVTRVVPIKWIRGTAEEASS